MERLVEEGKTKYSEQLFDEAIAPLLNLTINKPSDTHHKGQSDRETDRRAMHTCCCRVWSTSDAAC